MKNAMPLMSAHPMIVRCSETSHNGIQSQTLSRYAIGYVLHGTKYIYDGDKRMCLSHGDVFFLGVGSHYMEDVPGSDRPFEQLLFYYTPAELQRIMSHLSITYGLNISNDHLCEKCQNQSHVMMGGWAMLRNFFLNVNDNLRDENFSQDKTAESIKLSELIYLIVSHEGCCLKNKVLGSVDTVRESFEQVVHTHIFKDVSIDALANLSHRSLTSFKKEFKRLFRIPPHKWFIRQRLMHARLLLISTSKSIYEIGMLCTLPNTSHFIKLFKKEYGITPSVYRHHHVATKTPAMQVLEVGELHRVF
ncbi:MAG: AraC family transcriptional regulator [Alistipes sp.]